MSDLATLPDDGIYHQATTDADGVLTGLLATNVLLPGAVVITAGVFADLRDQLGRTRLVDGAWVEFTPPPAAPGKRVISPRQLWLAASSIGVSKASVLAAIAAMPDAAARDWLTIELTEASAYEPDHPAIDDLRALLDIPQTQFDDLWIWASGL